MHLMACCLARRVFEYGPGALLGASDFFMNGPARFRVVAAEPCRLLCLSRESLQRMMRQKPEARAWQHLHVHHVPMCTSGTVALAPHRSSLGRSRVIRVCMGVKPAARGRSDKRVSRGFCWPVVKAMCVSLL